MTIRVAILAFLVSFATITGWLVLRQPADSSTASNIPSPQSPQQIPPGNVANDNPKPATKTPPTENVIALSDAEINLREKLNRITIPLVEFEQISLFEALDFLRLRARELDPVTNSSIGFIARYSPHTLTDPNEGQSLNAHNPETDMISQPIITFSARNISLKDALDKICQQAGYQWNLEDHKIVLTPLN